MKCTYGVHLVCRCERHLLRQPNSKMLREVSREEAIVLRVHES
jgi:hypothetical protein